MNGAFEFISIIIDIIKKQSLHGIMMFIVVSVFLIAYLDTSSLITALRAVISIIFIAFIFYSIFKILEYLSKTKPNVDSVVDTLAAILFRHIIPLNVLKILYEYLATISSPALSSNAEKAISAIISVGIYAYLLSHIYNLWKKV